MIIFYKNIFIALICVSGLTDSKNDFYLYFNIFFENALEERGEHGKLTFYFSRPKAIEQLGECMFKYLTVGLKISTVWIEQSVLH